MSQTTAFDRIQQALDAHGARPQPAGQNQVTARCPAHDDQNPSLSLTRIEGQALVKCHADCTNDAVLAALGMSMRDLFDSPRGVDYRYDDGRVVHRKPDKTFRQSGNKDSTPQLYRLARVQQAVAGGATVYVVEGEKDVHALDTLGVTATCSPMGAGKAGKADWSPLAGATVVIVADNDDNEKGRKHARQVADQLAGVAAEITTVQATVGKDAADHVAAGYELADFITVEDTSELEWEPPLPLGEPGEQPPFPTSCLGPLRDIVTTVADAYQVPADLAAMTALTTVSAALGGMCSARVRGHWHEASGLYTATVARSSERKSPPFARLTAPLRNAETRLSDDSADKRAEHAEQYDLLHSRYEDAKRAAGKRASSPNASSAGRDQAQYDMSTYREKLAMLGEPPAAPRIVASDITPEAAARLMHEQHGRLALLATEGGIFDTLAGRYSNTPNFDVFLNGYSGEPVTVDRQNAAPLRIDSARVTIALTVQPHVLESIAAKTDVGFHGRGLLGRFLYALPASVVGHRAIDPPEPDTATLGQWDTLIGTLVSRVWNADQHRVLPLDEDAATVLHSYRIGHEPRLADGGDLADLPDWAGKLPGHLVRIALVLTLADNPHAEQVTGHAMTDAIGMSGYFEAHARHAYQLMTGGRDEKLRSACALLTWIRHHKRTAFTTREAWQGVRGQNWADNTEAVTDALQQLADYGWIAQADTEPSPAARGRPRSPQWVVSPYAHRRPYPQNPQKTPSAATKTISADFGDTNHDREPCEPLGPRGTATSSVVEPNHDALCCETRQPLTARCDNCPLLPTVHENAQHERKST